MNKGKYIVLEGPEGSGKTTQITELARRLNLAKLPCRILREPDSQFDLTAREIRRLTQDPHYDMNTRTEVLLYNAARSQLLEIIKESIDSGIICICDRNYLSTLAVQYYGRGDIPDYNQINDIINFTVDGMEPDLCIVLDAPVKVLRERLKGRYSGERFDNLDESMLERIRSGYLWEAHQRKFPIVFATDEPEVVADNIWKLVSESLAIRTKSQAASSQAASIKQIIDQKTEPPIPKLKGSAESTNRLTKNKDGTFTITDSGYDYLNNVLTNSTDDVYVFNDNISPATVAAAMARLSRRGDDLRITLLEEFADKVGKDDQLLKRIITAFGDDSVQQLAGLHFVFENASNLLTKKLEWGRLAAYLEQSTRYIYYDQKDSKGNYKYYIPEELKPAIKKQYKTSMDKIFDTYSYMVRTLADYIAKNSKVPEKERDIAWKGAVRAQACDAIRPVLPTAVKATVGVFASAQALESLYFHLESDELRESVVAGEKLLSEARKVMPMFLERADKPERGGAFIAYRSTTNKAVKKMASDVLDPNYASSDTEPVVLTDYYPKNEIDLVSDMLYTYSHLSLSEIKEQVNKLPYKQKSEIFKAYMGERLNRRHRPGRALEKAHYSWDLLCDYGIFRDLQRHRMVDDLEWQILTPRYGYEIPELVEKANLVDKFEECFAESLKLHSILDKSVGPIVAQYAVLLGHKMRWKVTINAREAMHLYELRTGPQGHPGYRKLSKQMYDKLAEVHPLLASSMIFVNKDEDPELTRLAAERYTQFKLKELDKTK